MNRPLPALASVFYLRLADFAFKPVAEQARLRTQLESAVGAALVAAKPEDRTVLDAADGFILVVLADPAQALALAEACLSAAAALPLCVGGNHGPVAVVDDDSLTGDGIRSAATAAAFARPGQMLLTAEFRAALAAHSPDRSVALRRAGVFSDASIRTHELFAADPAQRRRRRRRLAAGAAAIALAMVGGGAALRTAGTVPSLGVLAGDGTVVFDVAPAAEVFIDGRRRGTTPPLEALELSAGVHQVELRHGADPPHRLEIEVQSGGRHAVRHVFAPPAVVRFDIRPGGEVFVDGQSRGGAPALTELELPAGPHRIEVRHPDFAPYAADIALEPGQNLVVSHTFAAPAVLIFDIVPGGSVYIDGQNKGPSQELQRLRISAGRHKIEVRRGDFAPLQMDVTLKPGEEVVVSHRFERSKPEQFFGKLKRKLGF